MVDPYDYVSSHPIGINTAASAMPSLGFAKLTAEAIKKNTAEHAIVLPKGYYQMMGQLTALWAFQEWLLFGCIGRLMGIDRKLGRIAMGTPRADDCIRRIKQLLAASDLKISADLTELNKLLKVGEAARDLMGHGIWVVPAGTSNLCVQDISGAWDTGEQDGVSRRVYPEGKTIDQTWFEDKKTKMLDSIQRTDALYKEIDAIAK